MKHAIAHLILIVAFSAPWSEKDVPPPGVIADGEVSYIVDGDTLDVTIKRVVRIRLKDCWTEETKLGANTTPEQKKRGLAAKTHLKDVALGKRCRIFIPIGETISESLTLERTVGWVWVNEMEDDLSTHQVKSGHAKKSK
jgi:endonuclease YncB( thermonuclease family)